jgi:hypothetical protein
MDMSSPCAQILHRASEVLAEVTAENPSLAPRLGPVSGILRMLAADVDGRTASQLAQVNAIRTILQQAQEIMPSPGWPQLEQLIRFAPASPADYGVDVLEEHLDRLKRALIEVHTWLETTAEEPGRARLLREIWAYLDQQATHASRLVSQLW